MRISSFGQNDLYISLHLLAIEPALRGLLIGGEYGTGKSSIVRALRPLWGDRPFVEVPISCTTDRLLGSMDWGKTLQEGRAHFIKGLIAQAHGGVLFLDNIHLFPSEILFPILYTLETGRIPSSGSPSDNGASIQISLIGTYNPSEGGLPDYLVQKMGMHVFTRTITHLPIRMYMTKRLYELPPPSHDDILRIERARRLLPKIRTYPQHIQLIAELAQRMGIQNNASEILVLRGAKAHAALHLREEVNEQDVYLSARLIFSDKIAAVEKLGSERPSDGRTQKQDATADERAEEHTNAATNPPTKSELQPPDDGSGPNSDGTQAITQPDRQQEHSASKSTIKELSKEINYEDAGPVDIPPIEGKHRGGKHVLAGSHVQTLNYRRGRHVRSVPGQPKQGKVDIIATIQAAIAGGGLSPSSDKPLHIRPEHFRIKQFRQKSGLLFIIAVDGSGSMAINRLHAARQCVAHLLQKSYAYRDKVSLLYFRQSEARWILYPGQSLTRAQHSLQKFPVGGRTPLSDALMKIHTMAHKARQHWHVAGTVLYLFTDGKANQPLAAVTHNGRKEVIARQEIRRLAKNLQPHLLKAVVFDTRCYYQQDSEARDVAKWLGAEYHYMPKRQKDSAILHIVDASVEQIRKGQTP